MLTYTPVAWLLAFFVCHTFAQSDAPSSTSVPTPTPAQDCKSVASANGAGEYADKYDCGAGGGENGQTKGVTNFIPKNGTPSKLRLRQDANSHNFDYQSAPGIISASELGSLTGAIVNTFDTSANLDGYPQVVLSQGERASIFSDEQVVRRSLYGRALCNASSAPIELSSGLGNKVTIIKADIPYDGGIIHITDGFFTPPSSLADTLTATESTSKFSSYLANSNSTSGSSPSVTVFAPNDAAFLSNLSSNATISPEQINSFVDAHVIQGFAAYSPLLVSGASYKTASGARVNISTTPDGLPVINGNVTVVQPDIIIANGVVHIIDQLLTPPSFTTPSPTPIFTGAAGLSPLRKSLDSALAGVVWTLFLGLGVGVYGVTYFGA